MSNHRTPTRCQAAGCPAIGYYDPDEPLCPAHTTSSTPPPAGRPALTRCAVKACPYVGPYGDHDGRCPEHRDDIITAPPPLPAPEPADLMDYFR
jgi:hypothetical protein